MLTAQLIIARAVHITASILLAGIFTFDLVIFAPVGQLGSGHSHEIEHRLFRLAAWSLVAAPSFRPALVLARSRKHEWIAVQECFLGDSMAHGFV